MATVKGKLTKLSVIDPKTGKQTIIYRKPEDMVPIKVGRFSYGNDFGGAISGDLRFYTEEKHLADLRHVLDGCAARGDFLFLCRGTSDNEYRLPYKAPSMDSYTFRDNCINFDQIIYDCLEDGKVCFLLIGKMYVSFGVYLGPSESVRSSILDELYDYGLTSENPGMLDEDDESFIGGFTIYDNVPKNMISIIMCVLKRHAERYQKAKAKTRRNVFQGKKALDQAVSKAKQSRAEERQQMKGMSKVDKEGFKRTEIPTVDEHKVIVY